MISVVASFLLLNKNYIRTPIFEIWLQETDIPSHGYQRIFI